MKIYKCLLTNNDCYKANKKMKPSGILVHSTGANNTSIARYVQPDDGVIGKNKYDNDWNRSGVSKCVHAFIGKDKNGEVKCYQTLPFDVKSWGCGVGTKGSYNSSHIQFEICEDDLKNETYFNNAMELAIEFCAYLCKTYDIKVSNIVSHAEAHDKGYASNHGDPDYWLKKYGKTMSWFRTKVDSKLNEKETTAATTTTNTTTNTSAKASTEYYKACDSKYTSIVDGLNSIGVDSSKSFRTKIAKANGISNYTGTAEQNGNMLKLLKSGKLIKVDSTIYAVVNASDGLNMRDSKVKIICSIPYKTKIVVLKKTATGMKIGSKTYTMAQVKYDGKTGYVAQNYLEF